MSRAQPYEKLTDTVGHVFLNSEHITALTHNT